jgi:hypothetical protein
MIGVVVTYLRRTDIPSFSEFRSKVMEAVTADGAEILDVKKVITVPDYEQMFREFAVGSNITGKFYYNIHCTIKYICRHFKGALCSHYC